MPVFEQQGHRFSIEPFQIDPATEKYGCTVCHEGSNEYTTIREPGAISPLGPIVQFDSPEEAIEAGEEEVLVRFLNCNLIQRTMRLVLRCARQNPDSSMKLIIPRLEIYDWRKLTPSDWANEGWEDEDQELTSLKYSDDVFLQALKRRLNPHDVVEICVEETLHMKVVLV